MGSGHRPQSHRAGKAAVAFFGGDDRQQTVGVHGVDRLHFRKLCLQLLIQRHAGGRAHQIVDFGPWHTEIERFKNRFAAIRDFVDAHYRHVTTAGVVAGKLTERPLYLTLAAFNHPFEDHFRTPGHVKAGQRRGGDGIRALAQRAGHFIF